MAKSSAAPELKPMSQPRATAVPDEFLDMIAPWLKEGELRVMLYLIRRICGFADKHEDAISQSQFVRGIVKRDGVRLDWGTGMGRKAVSTATNSLVERGLIRAKKRVSASGDSDVTVYSIIWAEESEGLNGRVPKTPPGSKDSTEEVESLGLPQDTVESFTEEGAFDVSFDVPQEKGTDTSKDSCPKSTTASRRAQKASADAALEGRKAVLLEALPSDNDRALVEVYLENAAAENKTGKVTLGKQINAIVALEGLLDELTAEDEATAFLRWRYGMQQANEHGVANVNYAKKAAYGWDPAKCRIPAGSGFEGLVAARKGLPEAERGFGYPLNNEEWAPYANQSDPAMRAISLDGMSPEEARERYPQKPYVPAEPAGAAHP